MIFAAFTRQPIEGTSKKQADYQKFTDVDAFVDWFRAQGDKLVYSLSKKNRSLTQNGWVRRDSSPAQILQAIDSSLKMVTTIDRIVSDEGILFDNVIHCSEELVSCIASKCVLKV